MKLSKVDQLRDKVQFAIDNQIADMGKIGMTKKEIKKLMLRDCTSNINFSLKFI